MYREIAGTDERVRANPGVRDRRVRATKFRLYYFPQNIFEIVIHLRKVEQDLHKVCNVNRGQFFC